MRIEWADRLSDMEDWYRDLLQQGDADAESALLWDYSCHVAFLRRLRGRILDVGGGAGLSGRFLDPQCDYWVIDPSAVWEEPGWREFSERFSGGRAIRFVRGTGEALPFADDEFDAALALWSLNHAMAPERCIAEMARVVRPGGAVLLVLEDMEPSWGDVSRFTVQRLLVHVGIGSSHPLHWHQEHVRTIKHTLRRKLPGGTWPLQQDHIRIDERALRSWIRPRLDVRSRSWRDGFLTFELAKVR